MSSTKTQPMYRGPLISELEQAVRSGSQETRVRTLRRITDLFLGTKEKLSEEQIDVFDEVLSHLIARMESTALIELSERLAPVNNAPNNVVHTLAVDEEIAVAGPILALSDRLTTQDLVEIAMAKGQSHLLAISRRSSLSASLTDVLVERGDTQVITALAENAGAELSEKAYSEMVDKSETDETLLEKLGLRVDIPLHIFRRLLERVSEAVRTRILALAPAGKRDDIAEILASISNDTVEVEEVDRDFAAAQRLVRLMHEKGELDQVALLGFAKSRQCPPCGPYCRTRFLDERLRTTSWSSSKATTTNCHPRQPGKCLSSGPANLRRSARTPVTALATWSSRRTAKTSTCSTSFPDM